MIFIFFKQLVIQKLNLVFGDVPASDVYWNKELKTLIRNKFESALSDYELKEDYNLKKHFSDSIPGIFFRHYYQVLLLNRTIRWKMSFVQEIVSRIGTSMAFCNNERFLRKSSSF